MRGGPRTDRPGSPRCRPRRRRAPRPGGSPRRRARRRVGSPARCVLPTRAAIPTRVVQSDTAELEAGGVVARLVAPDLEAGAGGTDAAPPVRGREGIHDPTSRDTSGDPLAAV